MKKRQVRRSLTQSSPAMITDGLPASSIEQKKIDQTFRLMNKAGIIAKQTPEWEENHATGMFFLNDQAVKRGKRPFGFAYWHCQEEGCHKGSRELWIGYDVLMDFNFAPIQSRETVAKTICKCLVKAGVPHVRIGSWKILVVQHADPTSAKSSMEFLALEPTGRVI